MFVEFVSMFESGMDVFAPQLEIGLKIEVHTTPAAFAQLESEWNALVRQKPYRYRVSDVGMAVVVVGCVSSRGTVPRDHAR
ncbi:MAG: hypothetical protein HND48_11490 [Chloroflexi bacterium]|nr:hypothetical protein [Chloroflexota bacterium]